MSMKSKSINIVEFRKKLLVWYHHHKRPLPFRKTKDPYKIWLSEIMLQQTTMSAVLSYYKRFTKKYPDILSVARAPEQELLTIWQGLGYYSRIKNFQKACRQVIDNFGGKIPQTFQELITLKGIGAYTASAISSICFDEPNAVVDGNVKRVLARIYHYKKDIDSKEAKKFFLTKASALLDPNHPGDFNEAMMDLGATLCQPQQAQCLICPVRTFCLASQKNPLAVPVKKKMVYLPVQYAALIITDHEKILLKKPSQKNLIANMWELPCDYASLQMNPEETWQTLFEQKKDFFKLKKAGKINHAITNKKISTDVYSCLLTERQLTKLERNDFKLIHRKDMDKIPINTLSKKILVKYFSSL